MSARLFNVRVALTACAILCAAGCRVPIGESTPTWRDAAGADHPFDLRATCGPAGSNRPIRPGVTRAEAEAAVPALRSVYVGGPSDREETSLDLDTWRTVFYFLSIEDGLIGVRRMAHGHTLHVRYGRGDRVRYWAWDGRREPPHPPLEYGGEDGSVERDAEIEAQRGR